MLPELNDTELDVMNTLWKKGKLSAREIHDAIGQPNDWSYSTTRTVLQRMVAKGYLKKAAFHGLNLYQPTISKAAGLAKYVHNFARHVLDTDLAPVVSLLASTQTLSKSELDDLVQLLDQAEEDP